MTNEQCLCGNSLPDNPTRCSKCGLAMCDACAAIMRAQTTDRTRSLGPECNADILETRRDQNAGAVAEPGKPLRTPIAP